MCSFLPNRNIQEFSLRHQPSRRSDAAVVQTLHAVCKGREIYPAREQGPLVQIVYYKHGMEIEDLQTMFKLSKRRLKAITKKISKRNALSDYDICSQVAQATLKSKMASVVQERLSTKRDLLTVSSLQEAFSKEEFVHVSKENIRQFLKDDMNLTQRKVRHQGAYINSEKNIHLRAVFAKKMINLINQGKTVINFDESIISGSTGRAYSWEKKGEVAGRA